MGFLTILGPILSGLFKPVQDYLNYKNQELSANRDLKLAQIAADKEAIISGNQAQTSQIDYYLKAINKGFRQGFICFVVIPFCISMFAPEYSVIMWHNFESMPEWYRLLLMSVCSVVLGLPVASAIVGQMFSSASKGLEARRDYKLEKFRINRKAMMDVARLKFFPKGMNEAQVAILDEMADAGERHED